MDCNYYFLSKTATEIWQADDVNGQNKMYECLSAMHKENFFKQVIFKSKAVPEYMLTEIAESVFKTSWSDFNNDGKAGKIVFEKPEYTGLFYVIFKRKYIRLSTNEIRKAEAENEFRRTQIPKIEMVTDKDDNFSPRTQRALNKISVNCRQLLIWKHIECLSHDEIARRKNIDRNSSIKMVSRCAMQFLKIWRTNLG